MSTFLKKLLENDEPVSIQKIAASLFALVLIRTFLEFFSNPDSSGLIFGWETTYLHFPLFYFSLFLSFTLLLLMLTKKTIVRIWNFLILVFVVILSAPIIDLFATNGKGASMSYITTEPGNFMHLFMKFLRFAEEPGITLGMRVLSFLLLSFILMFILKNTGSILKALIGTLVGYAIIFFYAIIPSIVAVPYLWYDKASSATVSYAMTLNQGLIQTTRQALPLSLTSIEQQNFFHAIFMSQVFWLFIVIQLFLMFIVFNHKYRKIFKKNFPTTRIIYWSIIALIGIFLSQKAYVSIDPKNVTTLVSFCVIFLLGVLNTFFAVCINDSEDTTIDIVSNPTRPLVNKDLSPHEWNKLTFILLFLVVCGLATMNSTMAFFFIMTQMAYYLYSARPLRFKKHFVSSSIIIGISSVGVAMAGFFFTSIDKHLSAFPIEAIFIIAVAFGLLSNMKDIKDYEGDKRENMRTLPVVFGLENSKKIIAFLYALVFISVPLLLNLYSMLFFAILCALFAFYLFTKKQYQEKYIFLILFFYAAMLFATVI